MGAGNAQLAHLATERRPGQAEPGGSAGCATDHQLDSRVFVLNKSRQKGCLAVWKDNLPESPAPLL